MENNGHLFISYSHKDGRHIAEKLRTELIVQGFHVWIDDPNINPTRLWTSEVENAIRAASNVLFCLTPDVLRDDSVVHSELLCAIEAGVPIYTLRFAEIRSPFVVKGRNPIDFFPDVKWQEGLNRLLEWLAKPFTLDKPRTISDKSDSPDQVAEQQVSQKRDPYDSYLHSLESRIEDYLEKTVYHFLDGDSLLPLIAVKIVAQDPALFAPFYREADISNPPPLLTNLDDVLSNSDDAILLLGGAGSGKTVTLMAYARQIIALRLIDSKALLPIVASISTWDAEKCPTLSNWLSAQTGIPEQNLDRLLGQNEALLLLDGLDELGTQQWNPISGEHYNPRLRFLESIQYQKYVVISCRRRVYEALTKEFLFRHILTLEPLTDDQFQVYLRSKPDLAAILENESDLRDALRSPILLSQFSFAYMEYPKKTSELRNLSKDAIQRKIFETYVERRYEREQRKLKNKLPFTVSEVKLSLGEIAVRLMLRTVWSEEDDITEVYAADALTVLKIADIDSFAEFCEDLGFFISRPIDAYYHYFFSHHLLRDFFAYGVLIDALPKVSGNERAKRIELLGKIGYEEAIPHLIPYLCDTDHIVHPSWNCVWGVTIDALKAIGLPAAHKMLELLKEKQLPNEIRPYVIGALGQIQLIDAVPFLIDTLKSSSVDDTTVYNTVKALRRIGKQATEQLLATAQNCTLQTLGYIVEILSETHDERACTTLVHILDDTTYPPNLRWEAARAIGQIACDDAVSSLVAALADSDETVRISAIEALVAIGDQSIVDELVTKASTENDRIRRESFAIAAVRLGDYRSIPFLAAFFETMEEQDFSVGRVINDIKDQRAISPLLEILKQTKNDSLRIRVNWKLQKLCDPNAVFAVDELIQLLLSTTDEEMQILACSLLGEIRDTRSIDALCHTLVSASSGTLKVFVAYILSGIKSPSTINALSMALGDTDTFETDIDTTVESEITVSSIAAHALGNIGTPEAQQVLEAWRRSNRLANN